MFVFVIFAWFAVGLYLLFSYVNLLQGCLNCGCYCLFYVCFLWLFKGLFVGCLTNCFAYVVVLLSCLYLFLVVCLCLNFIVLLHLPPV